MRGVDRGERRVQGRTLCPPLWGVGQGKKKISVVVMIAIMIVIMVIPMFGTPLASIFVPPAMAVIPAVGARLSEFIAPMLGL